MRRPEEQKQRWLMIASNVSAERSGIYRSAHLMRDEWKSFVSIGKAFAAHDTVRHSEREYARGPVHASSAEGFNDRVRRTISSVFLHITSHHGDLHFNEVGFRWSQRVMT